jgi:hypothetical protein
MKQDERVCERQRGRERGRERGGERGGERLLRYYSLFTRSELNVDLLGIYTAKLCPSRKLHAMPACPDKPKKTTNRPAV